MRTQLQASSGSNSRCSNDDDGAIGLAKDMPSGNNVSIALELQSRRPARQTIGPNLFGEGALSDLGGRPATRSDRQTTSKASPSTNDWEQSMRQVFPPGVNCHRVGTANTAHEGAPPARAEASGSALNAMYLPTDNFGRRRIGGQRPSINGDRIYKGRCRR